MRISDLKVGNRVEMDLLVESSSIRLTTSKKPFLDLALTDGVDKINGKVWNWTSEGKPAKNDVIKVTAEVSEWMGNKQLTVSRLFKSVKPSTMFAPRGDFDKDKYLESFACLVRDIQNDALRLLVLEVYKDHKAAWIKSPAASNVHHAYVGGLLEHSVDTALIAESIARSIEGCNIDLCVAGGLLHDVGKLRVYELEGAVINYTDYGHMMEHIVGGIVILENYRNEQNSKIVSLLQHIVASHHGELQYGSPVTPKFLEAWVVSAADNLDAKANIIKKLNKNCGEQFTEKSWALSNASMLSQQYIEDIWRDANVK